MSKRLTADAREIIRSLHIPSPGSETYSCHHCGGHYPCSTIVAMDHIDALEAENERLKAQVEAAEVLADEADWITTETFQYHVDDDGVERITLAEWFGRISRLGFALDAYRATATEE